MSRVSLRIRLLGLVVLMTPLLGGSPPGNAADRPQAVDVERSTQALDPALVDLCLLVARDVDPDLGRRLAEMRDRDPALLQKKLRQSRRLVALAQLRRRDATLYDLKLHELGVDAQVSRLATRWRRALADERAEEAKTLAEELRPQVTIQLGFRYRAREDYLCRLQELIDRLETELAHDLAHFNELYDRRVSELLAGAGAPLAAPLATGGDVNTHLGPGRASSTPWGDRLDRPGPSLPERLTPQLLEQCLEVARDLDAALATQLTQLRSRDEARFERKLGETRHLVALARLRERDPVLYDLKLHEFQVDAEVSRLAADVRAARREGRASDERVLQERLWPQVIVQLGFRHRARMDYLDRLQQLVERLQRELEHDRTHFAEMFERRMTELRVSPR